MLGVFGRAKRGLGGKQEAGANDGNAEQDVQTAYKRFMNNARKTWYDAFSLPFKFLRPLTIVAVVNSVAIVLLVGVVIAQNASQKVIPVITIVDPSHTRVLSTISVDPASFQTDKVAEMKFARDWVDECFAVTSDPRSAAAKKKACRSVTISDGPAITKIDGYFAEHDPIKMGETETMDVTKISVTPVIGDHRYAVEWSEQPYFGAVRQAPQDFKGEIALQVIIPSNRDELINRYPWTYVRDFSWGPK
jgi:type IV secretory pathway TrbF-like protein